MKYLIEGSHGDRHLGVKSGVIDLFPKDAGMLTEDWQPDGLSGPERALVTKAVCDRLKVNEVWQLFGQLWGEKPETLRAYYNKAMEQKKSLKFQDLLKNILD